MAAINKTIILNFHNKHIPEWRITQGIMGGGNEWFMGGGEIKGKRERGSSLSGRNSGRKTGER